MANIWHSDGTPENVQALHNAPACVDGDTITLPPNPPHPTTFQFTWLTLVHITKRITLKGNGIYTQQGGPPDGFTNTTEIIQNGTKECIYMAVNASPDPPGATPHYRVTGIKFTQPILPPAGPGPALTSSPSPYVNHIIDIIGTNHQVRIDNCRFTNEQTYAIYWNQWPLGVVDHCEFLGGQVAVFIAHPGWAGGQGGDGSYQTPTSFGTVMAVYVENCYHGSRTKQVFIDGEPGTRYCIRKCNMPLTKGIQNHGNEGAGVTRSCRQQEVYDNDAAPAGSVFCGSRGGTSVIHSNRITGTTTVNVHTGIHFNQFLNDTAREFGGNPPRPPVNLIADGTRIQDQNYPGGPFFTGTHTGANGSSNLMIDANANGGAGWAIDQLRGYSLVNVTKKRATTINHNTATSINDSHGDLASPPHYIIFDTGDVYQIFHLKYGLDQCGLGNDTVPLQTDQWGDPINNPMQPLDPSYVWGNTVRGVPNNASAGTTLCVVVGNHTTPGVHIINDNTPKPGYSPFIYPHPLVSGTVAPPSAIISVSGNLAFGNVSVGSSATRPLTISNSGTANLTVTAVSSGISQVVCTATFPITVPPAGSVNVDIVFTPAAATSYSGNITVSSDAVSGSGIIAFSGTGTGVTSTIIWQIAGSLAFGTVAKGSTAIRNVTFTNNGNTTGVITALPHDPGVLLNWTFPRSIAPGANDVLQVTADTSTQGSFSGTINVTSNATGGDNHVDFSFIVTQRLIPAIFSAQATP